MRLSTIIKTVLIAGVAGLLLAALLVFAFIKSGLYDVGASSPHTKLTQWVTHETMIHSVRRHAAAGRTAGPWTPAQVVAGFCAYERHCVACHGAAAVAREQWANGLEPQPPYLLDVTHQFTATQLFWVVKNGIKMTGMPAWRESMSDGEIWSVVAWLEASRDLPPQTYATWRAAGRCAPSPSTDRAPLAIPRP